MESSSQTASLSPHSVTDASDEKLAQPSHSQSTKTVTLRSPLLDTPVLTRERILTDASSSSVSDVPKSDSRRRDSVPIWGYTVWLLFFAIGSLNSLNYILVYASSNSFSKEFNASKFISVIQWFACICGILGAQLAALRKGSHTYKMIIACSLTVLAQLILASASPLHSDCGFSSGVAFGIVVLGCSFVAVAQAMGEAVIIMYLRVFHGDLMGAWSSGTGMAGLSGSFVFLLMSGVANFSNTTIFLTMLPASALLMLVFRLTQKFKLYKQVPQLYPKPNHYNYLATAEILDRPPKRVMSLSDIVSDLSVVPVREPVEGTFGLYCRCAKLIWWRMLCFGIVYFSEYTMSVGLSSHLSHRYSDSDKFLERTFYQAMFFTYQFGVFCTRSSLSLVRCRAFGVLAAIQFSIFLLWIIECVFPQGFFPLPLLYISMLLVGAVGGLMYVNVYDDINNDETIPDEDRPICVSLELNAATTGILLSAIFVIVSLHLFP
eukprot:255317_1